MEKRRNRGASRLQFSKEEQMQAVRAGQPERSHSPLLHQGIHAAHVQLHHQAAEANEDENSAVQAALTADDMQEEAFRAAAHVGKPPSGTMPAGSRNAPSGRNMQSQNLPAVQPITLLPRRRQQKMQFPKPKTSRNACARRLPAIRRLGRCLRWRRCSLR